jgi:hypothetical protein
MCDKHSPLSPIEALIVTQDINLVFDVNATVLYWPQPLSVDNGKLPPIDLERACNAVNFLPARHHPYRHFHIPIA